MTKEEAIQILSTRDAHGVLCGYTSGVTEALDMAIEALSRSGDLISRADAIEAWDKLSKRGRTEFDQVLMTLLSADAEWIPCSERLPKRDELVLVTYKTTDRIHLCRYLDDGSENPWWSYIDDCCAWNNVVLAWMPLPKPYRKDGEA